MLRQKNKEKVGCVAKTPYLCRAKTGDVAFLGHYDPLAQLVEHNTFNVGVLGSSPKRITCNCYRNP